MRRHVTEEKQKCTRCGKTKALTAFRRHRTRPNGRDSICKACRKRHDREAKDRSFGPLPERESSKRWLKEVWRRAAAVREENKHEPVRSRGGSPRR